MYSLFPLYSSLQRLEHYRYPRGQIYAQLEEDACFIAFGASSARPCLILCLKYALLLVQLEVSFSLKCIINMANFVVRKMFQDIPIKIRLFVMDNIVITRAEDIVHIFKQSAILTNKPYRKFVSNTFGVPEESRVLFAADETGLRHTSQRGTTTKQEYRVDYLMHTFITQFMSGPSLGPLATRFTENLISRLELEDIGYEWRDYPDLYEFVRDHMFHSSLTAMFGEQLFKLKPNFCEEFWAFEKNVPDLAKGVPQWTNRRAINARDRCLASVQEWGTYLEEQSAVKQTCDPIYDPVFGSEIVQKRHAAFAKMPTMSSKAIACEDLGLIWA